MDEAQAAVDAWVAHYNAERPHQALDEKVPVTPAERFAPVPAAQRNLVDLWLPAPLEGADGPVPEPAGSGAGSSPAAEIPRVPAIAARDGGPVEFDRVVPPSGNLQVAGKQFWLSPARAGTVIRLWADCDLICLSTGGTPIKTLRSHLSPADLVRLTAQGAVPAGPSPLPPAASTQAVEVERPVSRGALVSLGNHPLLAAEILGGQLVGIRIEPATLMFYDPATRVLLRTRPNPLTPDQVARLRGARPAGPPPRPSADPVRVQRRVSATGVIMAARQRAAPGTHPRRPDRHRPGGRHHPHYRVQRRRNPGHQPHHHPAGAQHQRPAAADCPPLGREFFNGSGEFTDACPAVQLDGGRLAQPGLDGLHVPGDFCLLGSGSPVRVRGTGGDPPDEDVEWRRQQHNVVEAVIEVALVVNRPSYHYVGLPVEQVRNPGGVPAAACEGPAVVVGIDGQVTSLSQHVKQRGLPGAGHARDQYPCHQSSLGRRHVAGSPRVASKASGRGPPPPFPRPRDAHQLTQMCRTSVVGSHC